jgi:hypothetical protein
MAKTSCPRKGAVLFAIGHPGSVIGCSTILFVIACLLLALQSSAAPQEKQVKKVARRIEDTAEFHHQLGVAYHLRRCLDDASREYARVVELDRPRELNEREWALVRRFAPRVYVTSSEPFPLRDFAAVLHPSLRLIAYHFFWEDDIDFPEDNDPCDHEVVWVQYSTDGATLEKIWTYFHGRILEGLSAAVEEGRRNGMRARINVQWGKHGSMPFGWEELSIVADAGDAESKYYPLGPPISLQRYNEGLYRKLAGEGRRLAAHPLGERHGWPKKFTGTWNDFIDFSRRIEPLELLDKGKLAMASRWNSATINQYFLFYNFRPKTEWPVEK